MSVLLMLIPISLFLAATFVVVCLISIRTGQFDDLESPQWRILFNDSGSVHIDGSADPDRTTGLNGEKRT